MLRAPQRFSTPLLQAVWSTVAMALFGVLYRFIGGAFDLEMRSWALVATAPFLGVLIYLQRAGRDSAVAVLLLALGIGGLLFWTLVLATGALPITGQVDLAYIAIIFAFPIGCIWVGWRQWRKAQEPPRPNISE